MTEVKAVAKNLRGSPRKARIVADAVRGKKALYAIEALRYMPNRSALDIRKVVQSAVANAVNNHELNAEGLVVKRIMVDSAFTIKRMRAQSRGRGRSILKRNCHVTVFVGEVTPVTEAAAKPEAETQQKTIQAKQPKKSVAKQKPAIKSKAKKETVTKDKKTKPKTKKNNTPKKK